MKNKKLKLSKLAWIKGITYALIYLAIILLVTGIKYYDKIKYIIYIFLIVSFILVIYAYTLNKNDLSKTKRIILRKEIKIAYYTILTRIIYVGMAFAILFTIYGFFFLTDQPMTSNDWTLLEFVLGIEILAIIGIYFLVDKGIIKKLKEELKN